jgi:hypothetical protein
VSISSSGQYALGCIDGGQIWYSSDFGYTWAQATTQSLASNWQSVSISSTGQYAIACAGGQSWYSFDYGVTWTQSNLTVGLSPVSISGNGQYAIAGASGQIYCCTATN